MGTGPLAVSDFCIGLAAVVGLALMAFLSVKLWRENRETHRLMDDPGLFEFFKALYKSHPEAYPLSNRFILGAFLALLLAFIILLLLSRR